MAGFVNANGTWKAWAATDIDSQGTGVRLLSLFARASFTFRQYELLSPEMRHIPDGKQSQGPLRIQ